MGGEERGPLGAQQAGSVARHKKKRRHLPRMGASVTGEGAPAGRGDGAGEASCAAAPPASASTRTTIAAAPRPVLWPRRRLQSARPASSASAPAPLCAAGTGAGGSSAQRLSVAPPARDQQNANRRPGSSTARPQKTTKAAVTSATDLEWEPCQSLSHQWAPRWRLAAQARATARFPARQRRPLLPAEPALLLQHALLYGCCGLAC